MAEDKFYSNVLNSIRNKFGGEDPKPKRLPLTQEERAHWNGFADFVKSKGFEGSNKLDARDTNLSRQLFEEYNKGKGTSEYKYDAYVPAVQEEIADYRNTLINKIKAGQMQLQDKAFTGDLSTYDFDKNFLPGLSNVDGWAGSKTTGFRFAGVDRGANEISPQAYQQLYGSIPKK